MATFSMDVPDDQVELIGEAFADTYGYKEEVDGEPNDQTKLAFARQCVIDFVGEVVKAWHTNKVIEEARNSIPDEVIDLS